MKTLSSKVRVTLYLFAYCGIFAIGIFGMCSFAHAAGAKWVYDPWIETDVCIECALCVENHPFSFYWSTDGKPRVWHDADPTDVGEAADECPVQAIHTN